MGLLVIRCKNEMKIVKNSDSQREKKVSRKPAGREFFALAGE